MPVGSWPAPISFLARSGYRLVVGGSATHGPGVEAVVISGAFAAEAQVPGLLARPAASKAVEAAQAQVATKAA